MVWKPEKKKLSVRFICVCRWENYVRLCLKELYWEGMDWPYLAQNLGRWRAVMVYTIMNIWVP
jgi:hypothetical protein